MINIKPAVVAALKEDVDLIGLLGGPRIYFQAAPNAKEFPRITYYELDNHGSLYADDMEQASEILIVIDIWHTVKTSEIAQAVDKLMTGLGFVREFASDLYEDDTKIFHKTMRFRIGQEIF